VASKEHADFKNAFPGSKLISSSAIEEAEVPF
jgi:hypothetical protein